MSKFLVTLPYNSAYLMSAKDFATFAEIVANSLCVTQDYYYDKDKNYTTQLVDNKASRLTATMTDEQPITAEQFSVLKETITNSTEEV